MLVLCMVAICLVSGSWALPLIPHNVLYTFTLLFFLRTSRVIFCLYNYTHFASSSMIYLLWTKIWPRFTNWTFGTAFYTYIGCFGCLGTRIVYDRAFLMQCRNSPLAKSPPNLPKIPGVTCPVEDSAKGGKKQKDSKVMQEKKPAVTAGENFLQ